MSWWTWEACTPPWYLRKSLAKRTFFIICMRALERLLLFFLKHQSSMGFFVRSKGFQVLGFATSCIYYVPYVPFHSIIAL